MWYTLRKVVIKGMACQLPSSQEVWRKLLSFSYCTLVCTKQSYLCRKNYTTYLLPSQVIVRFSTKKDQNFLWCQIDFWVICNFFCSNHFVIRCQIKVLLYQLQFSLKPDCKNLGSGVPSLMAADKPCLLLQPSLVYI